MRSSTGAQQPREPHVTRHMRHIRVAYGWRNADSNEITTSAQTNKRETGTSFDDYSHVNNFLTKNRARALTCTRCWAQDRREGGTRFDKDFNEGTRFFHSERAMREIKTSICGTLALSIASCTLTSIQRLSGCSVISSSAMQFFITLRVYSVRTFYCFRIFNIVTFPLDKLLSRVKRASRLTAFQTRPCSRGEGKGITKRASGSLLQNGLLVILGRVVSFRGLYLSRGKVRRTRGRGEGEEGGEKEGLSAFALKWAERLYFPFARRRCVRRSLALYLCIFPTVSPVFNLSCLNPPGVYVTDENLSPPLRRK